MLLETVLHTLNREYTSYYPPHITPVSLYILHHLYILHPLSLPLSILESHALPRYSVFGSAPPSVCPAVFVFMLGTEDKRS